MRIVGTQKVEVEVSREELANTIQKIIVEDYFDNDLEDVGSVWYTKEGRTYIDNENNLVATDTEVAALTDTMNILKYGSVRILED